MNLKQLVGEKASDFLEDGMVVGLGTGSTVYWTILKIGELVKNGLEIKGVPTSKTTERLAIELGIPLVPLSSVKRIDLTIDGADEATPEFTLIKGGGGALLREKMVASISEQFTVVVDESKYVRRLGAFPLPVEVVPFGWEVTESQVAAYHCRTNLRMQVNGTGPYVTDNGNYILDCRFGEIKDPLDLNGRLNTVPGVVETGLFVEMADKILIGRNTGSVDELNK